MGGKLEKGEGIGTPAARTGFVGAGGMKGRGNRGRGKGIGSSAAKTELDSIPITRTETMNRSM
jgi:hypothetical protein